VSHVAERKASKLSRDICFVPVETVVVRFEF
jgi:hypothetical protein